MKTLYTFLWFYVNHTSAISALLRRGGEGSDGGEGTVPHPIHFIDPQVFIQTKNQIPFTEQ
jgi:hypothetical protein